MTTAVPSPNKAYRVGLDLGSTAAKAALIDAEGALLGVRIDESGRPPAETADELARDLLGEHGLHPYSPDVGIVATGYGRSLAESAAKKVTEITCHARGVRHLHPDAVTILDIGGQDAKAIRLDADGGVQDFAMNDRCAAGTGRFLEVAARRHGVEIGDVSAFCGGVPDVGEDAEPFEISSTCVVFAESELVSLHARGVPPVEALRAVHRAIARRTALLLKQVGATEPCYFTGGVARNAVLLRAIARETGLEIHLAEHPQFTGALGAALLA